MALAKSASCMKASVADEAQKNILLHRPAFLKAGKLFLIM